MPCAHFPLAQAYNSTTVNLFTYRQSLPHPSLCVHFAYYRSTTFLGVGQEEGCDPKIQTRLRFLYNVPTKFHILGLIVQKLLDKFCYLGEKPSVDGDADAAVETRIRIA